MQVIWESKDEGSTGGGTNPVGVVLYAGGVSGYVEGECVGRIKGRGTGI